MGQILTAMNKYYEQTWCSAVVHPISHTNVNYITNTTTATTPTLTPRLTKCPVTSSSSLAQNYIAISETHLTEAKDIYVCICNTGDTGIKSCTHIKRLVHVNNIVHTCISYIFKFWKWMRERLKAYERVNIL